MAMGTRKGRERQEEIWYSSEVAEAPGHPFYRKLEAKLKEAGFDRFCEEECKRYYADGVGRPSLVPGVYFRLMLIGFFEGIDSERGIAWRVADSLSLRQFLGYGIDENTPDHVTISRTRRLLEASTHKQIFDWVLEQLAQTGLVKGKTMGVDSTTLEANAATKIEIERCIAPDASGILADPELVLRCLTNLIENSVRYAASGKWILLSARRCRYSGRSMVEVTIEDRGPGIERDEAAAVFEPFYRGRSARRSREPGSGLGLAIARHATEAQGGWIKLERVVPKGCRFRSFSFPRIRQWSTPWIRRWLDNALPPSPVGR